MKKVLQSRFKNTSQIYSCILKRFSNFQTQPQKNTSRTLIIWSHDLISRLVNLVKDKNSQKYVRMVSIPFPSVWNFLTCLFLSHFYLLYTVQKISRVFPLEQYLHSDKRKDKPEGGGGREREMHWPRETERQGMNGLEATLLVLTKGGPGTKTSGVNILFHSLSQTVLWNKQTKIAPAVL